MYRSDNKLIDNAGNKVTCTTDDEPKNESFKKIPAIDTSELIVPSDSLNDLLELNDFVIDYGVDYGLRIQDGTDNIVYNIIADYEEDNKDVHSTNEYCQTEPKQQMVEEQNLQKSTDKFEEYQDIIESWQCQDDDEANPINGNKLDRQFDSSSVEETKTSRFSSILGEINLNYFFPDLNSKCAISDYSNKLLIIKRKCIKIVKSRFSSSSKEKMIFVIDSSLFEQIKENTYNLDDLQYGIAKAIGIEPDKLRISYLVDQFKNIKTDYSLVKFGRMWEQSGGFERGTCYLLNPTPFKQTSIKTKVYDQINEKRLLKIYVNHYTAGSKWLGGYRNTGTDSMYYNASTQTQPSWCNYTTSTTRNTQTRNPIKEKSINTAYDHSTQMWRLDHYMPADTDLIINPGIYGIQDAKKMRREQAAIIFQKFWRGYKARKYIIPKLREAKVIKQSIRKSDKQDVDTIKTMMEKIILNLAYPYKKFHFLSLYWILKKRKLHLQNKLNLMANKSSKLANTSLAIESMTKELESLQGIDILRQAAYTNRMEKEKVQFLEQSFGPTIKQFPDRNNIYFIEEFGIENCKRLKELYVLYRRQDISAEERLEVVLLCLQSIESCWDFEMKEDLQELLNRECILISSGVPEYYLQGLRKRAEEIIYNFVRMPLRRFKTRKFLQCDFCPIFRCISCRKYKSCQDFPMILGNKYKTCKSCRFTHRTGSVTENTSSKMYHLQLIRLDEYKRGCQNPYITIIQPSVIHDLIFNIWGGRSAISEDTFFRDLRLVRWNIREPWAPWNTILLTSKEAIEHNKIKNINEFYSEYFCNYVKHKNLAALKKYGVLIYVENSMRNVWSWLPDNSFKATAKTIAKATEAAGEIFFHPSRKSNICS